MLRGVMTFLLGRFVLLVTSLLHTAMIIFPVLFNGNSANSQNVKMDTSDFGQKGNERE